MFKKLLSSMTVMLLAFCMNAGAQSLQVHKADAVKSAPSFAAVPRTSVLELEGDERWTGYWEGDFSNPLPMLGMNMVPMQYDVAICYPAGSVQLKNMEVTGIRFTFSSAVNMENVKVWMSTTLPATPEQADIVCDAVTDITDINNTADPANEVRFSKAYKVDMSMPLYIGYSFDVNNGEGEAEKFPIAIDMNTGDMENALLIKGGGEEGAWMDYNGYNFGKAAIQILVKGSLPGNAALIPDKLPDVKAVAGASDITFPVVNAGTNPLNSIKVTTSADGFVLSECEYNFDYPVSGIGSKTDVTINSVMPETSGRYQLGIIITEVNGEVLEEPVYAGTNLLVVSEKAVRRPLMEEITGMLNGWAPRGMIAQQKLYELYGDELSFVSVHVFDNIACTAYEPIYQSLEVYPAAFVDRTLNGIDPYYGSSDTEFGIGEDIRKAHSTVTVADVSAEISLNDNVIDATANVKFLYSEDVSNYALGYVLVEDGMNDETWVQSNAYPGFKGLGMEDVEPLFEPWVNGEEEMRGIYYDNVAIAVLGIENGLEGSVPSPIKEGETVSNSVQFNLADYPLIKNAENLRVVAILFDNYNGCVENTAMARLNVETMVKGVDAGDVVETARYAVDGSRISSKQQGVNIVRYSDGSVRKVVVR